MFVQFLINCTNAFAIYDCLFLFYMKRFALAVVESIRIHELKSIHYETKVELAREIPHNTAQTSGQKTVLSCRVRSLPIWGSKASAHVAS